MQQRIAELGRGLVMFAAAAVIIGVAGMVLGAGIALDGHWIGYAGVVVGLLGVASGVMIWTGASAGSAVDGMKLGVLWALAHVPYVSVVDRGEGIDAEYPVPAFGAIFRLYSNQSENGVVVREDAWGVGFLGVILLVSALVLRKDWQRVVMRQSAR